MFSRILFPTDFSRHATKVLECLPALKNAGLEEVVLLHVINPIKAARWISVDESVIARLKREAQSQMEAIIAQICSAHGLSGRYRIAVGVTYQEIVRVATEEQVSLIIMGSHGRGFVRGAVLGSVTQNVLRHTRTPLLIEKFRFIEQQGKEVCDFVCQGMFRKILFPTDFSDCALSALQMVKQLRTCGAEEVVLVHIQDTRRLLPPVLSQREELQKQDQERLEEIKGQLHFLGYRVKSILREGIPFVEINRIAEEEDVCMIVLGSHGKSAIKEALIGSVSEAIAREHIRPVLVIPRNWEG
ncbi:MAG: universal stress protein [Nitrospinota bacterium]|nr:MAG: universal stress protein [Nitrospinota bacterium]